MMNFDLYEWLMFLSARAPYWGVMLFGVYLCFRNAGQKPREVRLVSIALALMVAGSASSYLIVPLLNSLGIDLFSGRTGWWLISAILTLPHALGLGLLFWAVFGGTAPYEEPVFRYDDEREPTSD